MQLFSVEQQKSQPLEAHAAAFSTVKVRWQAAACSIWFFSRQGAVQLHVQTKRNSSWPCWQ
jgi:hypothetical protein